MGNPLIVLSKCMTSTLAPPPTEELHHPQTLYLLLSRFSSQLCSSRSENPSYAATPKIISLAWLWNWMNLPVRNAISITKSILKLDGWVELTHCFPRLSMAVDSIDLSLRSTTHWRHPAGRVFDLRKLIGNRRRCQSLSVGWFYERHIFSLCLCGRVAVGYSDDEDRICLN